MPVPARLRDGLRASGPFAAAGFLLSFSFGAVATAAGFPPLATIVMSAVVFAGSAQFAALAVLSGGGSVAAAVGAAALMHSRFLPMGVALGPSLPGGPVRRAVQAQAMVDSSWAMSARGDGTYDRLWMFGHSGGQYVTWVLGTTLAVLGNDLVGDLDVRALGLDAIFPTFFLALLLGEVRGRKRGPYALAGAVVALTLLPFTPAGLPVLAAGAVALVGLRRPRA